MKMLHWKITFYITLAIAIPSIFLFCSRVKHYELSRFISPETCGGCHIKIYEQWEGSMHHLAHEDPLYRNVALSDLEGLTDKDEIEEAELCVKCHTPVGYVTGMPKKTSDHKKKIPDIAQEGVQCDFCHSSTGARKLYNAEMKLDPGFGERNPGTKRGPFKDSKSNFHESEYSKFHTTSKICAVCHDVHHVVFGTKLETPYEEWESGPYNSKDPDKRITCQGCHMYQRPGIPATGSTDRPKNPGVAVDDGPEREHIFTHYFVGGNTIIPAKLKKNTVQSGMARERLTNAAQVKIGDIINKGRLSIIVKNTGAGHKIPTGLTHIRHVWLEVTVTGAGGKDFFKSGYLDRNGYLDSNAVIFRTVFGDGKGNPVENIAKAREILSDKRIVPGGEEHVTYFIANLTEKKVTVQARLLYRLVSQKKVDRVFGKGAINIEPVFMASSKKIVKVQ